MGKRWAATIAVTGTMFAFASSASGAVEVGNDCVANSGNSNSTYVQTARATPSGLPLTVPSAGVVTSWKVRSSIAAVLSEKLKVFRSAGKPNQFTIVGESATQTTSQGTNVFGTRIPVQAGDRFGAFGGPPSGVALLCTTGNPGDESGVFTGPDPAVGSTPEFTPSTGLLIAVSAVVEPDADGDGFGDETQDKCPRSAALQTECPFLTISSFGIASKNSALILVASSSTNPVTVSASITVPGKAKKPGGKKSKAKVLTLSGPTQAVPPGQLGQFVISYSVPLKSALTALSPKRSLSLNVTVTGTDPAGKLGSTTIAIPLKGQAKPPKRQAKRK